MSQFGKTGMLVCNYKFTAMISNKEKERYSRHIILDEIGLEGQEKLKNSKVLIVGIGGLGSPLSLYLAAAGIGEIGLIDDDMVSESNLQRQILFNTYEIGKAKVDIAKEKLSALNPYIKFNAHNTRLDKNNALNIINNYDIIVDGCDNLLTRYIINDACVCLNKVYVYGSIGEFNGQVSVFNFNNGPTYRCLYPYDESIKDFTQPSGVVGVLPGVTATIQANEVIKVITNIGDILSGKLLLIDTKKSNFISFEIKRKHNYLDNIMFK